MDHMKSLKDTNDVHVSDNSSVSSYSTHTFLGACEETMTNTSVLIM